MEKKRKESDSLKIIPWNSSENPVNVNSIRYNQDYRLLILGTSKGYKIFSTTDYKLIGDENDTVTKYGDIHIASLYYSSRLVFILPSKYNKNYQNNELIIFDDYFQEKIGSFKIKSGIIENFFVSRNILSILTLKEIIILELFSLKIIEIIEDIAFNDKILSFNQYDCLAYTKSDEKQNFYLEYFESSKHKIIGKKIKKIKTNFDFIQIFQISPDGEQIIVVSIYGNKIHIYNTRTGKLKNCIFLGPKIQTFDKIFFSEKKPNYLLFIRNDKIFNVYKIGKAKDKDQIQKCICNIDNDQDLVKRLNELDIQNAGLSKPRSLSKSKLIREPHAYSDYKVRLLFADFDRNNHKDLLFINKDGVLFKYHFNKKKNGKIEPIFSAQWI